ncbi:MAG: plasmid stabilization protein [Nitrospirae bacterium]|nr:MAG: plasmid stabilization protein [Nitrospirota bacterium]
MFVVVTSNYFFRRARKFFRKHPELKERFAIVVDDLRKDPFHPHLEFHSLGGKLKGIQAVSLTDSYRITLTLMVTEREIILLDIGSHDEVYR